MWEDTPAESCMDIGADIWILEQIYAHIRRYTHI